LNNLSEL